MQVVVVVVIARTVASGSAVERPPSREERSCLVCPSPSGPAHCLSKRQSPSQANRSSWEMCFGFAIPAAQSLLGTFGSKVPTLKIGSCRLSRVSGVCHY